MNVDLKSAAIGALLVGAAWLASYGAVTSPAMQTLVREKAELTGQRNDAMQKATQWHEVADRTGNQMGACYHELQSLKDAHRQISEHPAPSDDAMVAAVGNLLHPGLGTAAVIAKKFVQKNQAGQCPAGSEPMTDPNWQGTKCVEVVPQ